jgi:tetratricopeptide (TPR) repeat protein
MLALLLTTLLGLVPQHRVVLHAAMLEQEQRTLDLIYNMEFDAALHAAQRLIDLAPTHPAGYFYRAATYWQRRLITHDPHQRAILLSQFQESTQRARTMAEHLPEAQAAEAAFYLGAVYGMQARLHFAEQQYLRALLAAKQGSAYLQQCVARAPDWYDAYAGLGTYQYVLSRVPGVWRSIVQQLIGIPGDRDKGLQALELARTAGRLSVSEAGSLLAKIYVLPGEEQYDKAYVILENLVQRYPHNSDYRYRLALVCAHLGLWECARQVSQQLIDDIAQGKPYAPQQWRPLLHYRLAETYVFQRQPQVAAEILRALRTQELSPALRAWVELRLGTVHDLQGERQAAQAWYQGVHGDAQAEARAHAYMAMPFMPAQIDLKPLEQAVI